MRELASIEDSIESIRAMNKDMRADQFDQEKRVKIIQAQALEMQATKGTLEGDHENVKQSLADKDTQIVDLEQTLTREQDRESHNISRRRELMERIEIMS